MTTKNACYNHPKNVLITGASSGIGEALAVYYAAPDIMLFLSGRNEQRLQAVAEQCMAKGAQVTTRIIDVRHADSMHDWIQLCDRQAPLDLVIANAGISGGTAGGSESEDQVRNIFAVNLDGVLNTIQPVLPLMEARGHGQIALMASLASFSAWPGAPAYGASKGAVRLYGEALRGAMRKTGVRINVICPGFVESRMTAVNDYPMPFLMDSASAAQIIARGLAHNTGRIAFPWSSYILAGILACLPCWLSQCILKNTPGKSVLVDRID